MPNHVGRRACRKSDGAGLARTPIRGMSAREGPAGGRSSLQGSEGNSRVPGVARLLEKGLDEKKWGFNRLYLRAGDPTAPPFPWSSREDGSRTRESGGHQ